MEKIRFIKRYFTGKTLILVMALLLPQVASAYDFEVGGIYYNINGNEATVTYKGNSYGSYDEYTGSVNIPSSVTYNGSTYSVTSIGEYAFFENDLPDLIEILKKKLVQ